MKAQPIWHPQHLEAVFVRHRFRLRQACAESLIRCAASGPYQVRLDNVRLGSGSGGSATHLPMWAEFAVEGSLSAGDHELLVQAAPAGEGAPPWVLCEGALTTSSGGDGEIGEVVQLATSANWWAAPSPTPGGLEAGADSEAFSALLDPTRDTAGDGEWVQAVAIPPGEASPIEGHPVAASEEEVRPVDMPSSGEIDLTAGRLDFVAAPGPMRTCKCVHREGILRGGRVPARVQTEGSDRAVYLILDFGRLVTGLPHLRLRHGAGGTIDMGFSCTWGQIHARARYICGSGRGEWVGLRSRTCRYLVLRLQGFEEACEIGCVSMLRPHIDAEAEATFSASGGVDAEIPLDLSGLHLLPESPDSVRLRMQVEEVIAEREYGDVPLRFGGELAGRRDLALTPASAVVHLEGPVPLLDALRGEALVLELSGPVASLPEVGAAPTEVPWVEGGEDLGVRLRIDHPRSDRLKVLKLAPNRFGVAIIPPKPKPEPSEDGTPAKPDEEPSP